MVVDPVMEVVDVSEDVLVSGVVLVVEESVVPDELASVVELSGGSWPPGRAQARSIVMMMAGVAYVRGMSMALGV